MKCHIGVDAGSGLVHTITVTAANAHDITQAAALIREDDEVVYGDAGYLGIQKRPEITSDAHLSSIPYYLTHSINAPQQFSASAPPLLYPYVLTFFGASAIE